MDSPPPPLENGGRPIQFGLRTLLVVTAGFAALFSLVAALRAVGFFLAIVAVGLLILLRGGANRAKLLVLGGQTVLVASLLGTCILSGVLIQQVTPSAARRNQSRREMGRLCCRFICLLPG